MGVLAKSNHIKPPKDLMLITLQVIGLVGIEEELHISRQNIGTYLPTMWRGFLKWRNLCGHYRSGQQLANICIQTLYYFNLAMAGS